MHLDTHLIVARWAAESNVAKNWGDKLNRPLIHLLSGLPVAHVKDVTGWDDRPVYRVIGSALGDSRRNEVIWGMGFIAHAKAAPAPPAMVCAVRGPMSRAKLLAQGIACPDIYGDPAVLYPLLYWPKVEQTHDYGIIQHFREAGAIDPVRLPEGKTVRRIDICGGIREVVDQILSCRMIVTSSLHGLICAHAYGIPAHWLKASDKPLGDDFKFHDYYASIGHPRIEPARADADGFFDPGANPSCPQAPLIDAVRLIEACPFMSTARKAEWLKVARARRREGRTGTIFMSGAAG